MLANLVVNKFVSLYIGPAGLAIIGQFQNVATLIQTGSQGGINAGVTKYTADYNSKKIDLYDLWGSSFRLTIFFTVIVSVAMYLFSGTISDYVFKTVSYAYLFKLFSVTLVFFSINQLMLSMLNGLKEIKQFITINITQSICSLILTAILIYFYNLTGALIALVTNQSMVFFITLWKFKKYTNITFERLTKQWSTLQAKRLLKYSLMALVTAACLPLSQMMVRDYISKEFSWDYAGYWQAMTYISTMYLMVVTVALSTYYLPRLSEINDKSELRKELIQGYKIIMPIVALMAMSVFFLKEFIVWVLFSSNFKPMLQLFAWQMIGDVFKIAGWLLAYLMLAKAMTKVFIITEIIFAISFYIISVLFINYFGFVGLSYAFAANYLIYLLTMFFVMRNEFN